ncbi:MAG: VOC family protein [Pyrinomonadaceae bacterium]
MSSTNKESALQPGHIGLNVRDLEVSKEFYGRVFGFEVLAESKEGEKIFAFLGRNDQVLITLWEQSDREFSRQTAGLHHLSFQVGDIEEVREAEKLLKKIGVKFHYDGVVSHSEGANSGGIFFEDPDGIRLEIYAPTGAKALAAGKQNAPSCGFF